MSQPTESRIMEVYINSFLDRVVSENDSASKSFTVLLPQGSEVSLLPNEKYKKIKCKVFNLQVPNVLYNFPEKSSRLFFDTNPAGAPNVVGFQINVNRIYATPAELVSELNTKAGAVSGLSITFSFSDSTKRMTITNTGANNIRMISSFRYALEETILTFEDMNDRLGFSQSLVNTIIPATNGTLIGQGFLNMNRSNCYYLSLDESSSYYSQSIVPSKPNTRRIIAQVAGGSYGTLSTFSYVSSEWFNLPNSQRINSLRFAVVDDEGDPIDVVNFPITMSLQIKVE